LRFYQLSGTWILFMCTEEHYLAPSQLVSYLNWILEPKTRSCFISKKPLGLKLKSLQLQNCTIDTVTMPHNWEINKKWEGSRRLNILHESHELSKHNIGRECSSELQSDLLEDIQKLLYPLLSFLSFIISHFPLPIWRDR